jgi:phage-related protein
MDSSPMQNQQQIISTPTTDVNGTNLSNIKLNVDDEDEQAVFLNHCIEKETIDFEKSAQDKRNAKIDG